MQSKRDQVQAHMFLMGRLTSSMLRADPDGPESPQGRTNRGVALGIIIALVVSAGAFVIGLISPGTKDSWRSSGALIVDRDTGSRYLYLDGRLRPVRNYASARLLGGDGLKSTDVRTASLRSTPRGTPVGVPGAPDSLPGADDLATGPWQVCSTPAAGVPTPRSPGLLATTTLAVGGAADGRGLDGTVALLVAGPDSSRHLVWRGSRFRLDRAGGALGALGYDSARPVPVSAAFLNSLPAGPDLAPPQVPERGGKGPALEGRATRFGQVFKVASPGAAERYYLLRPDGLAPLTATGAALALGDPRTRADAYDGRAPVAVGLGADALEGRLAPAGESPDLAELPQSPPELVEVTAEQLVCVRVQPDDRGPRVSVSLVAPHSLGPVAHPPAENLTPACAPVDQVTVPPGGGALVRALGAGGSRLGDTLYLVTDTGMKYRVPTQDALRALGYGSARPRELPSPLLSMLPTGPDLDPALAARGKAVTTAQRCAPVPRTEAASTAGSGED
jgi:type VII secretion protein EccB